MKLLKVNKPKVGDWLQIPHPTKSTHEITCWVGSGASITTMYVVPKPAQDYTYISIKKPPAS